MAITHDVNLGAVVDALVLIAHLRHMRDAVIRGKFICKNRALGQYIFFDDGKQRCPASVRDGPSYDAALAFCNAHHCQDGHLAAFVIVDHREVRAIGKGVGVVLSQWTGFPLGILSL